METDKEKKKKTTQKLLPDRQVRDRLDIGREKEKRDRSQHGGSPQQIT